MFKLKTAISALVLIAAWGFCFNAAAAPLNVSGFTAAPNPAPGLVNLSWNYAENLPSGATMYIQYNTADIGWSTASAQIVFFTPPVTAPSAGSYIAGVNVGRDGATPFPGSGYFFRVWVGTSNVPSGISSGVSSLSTSVNVPPATVLTSSSPAVGGALVSFDGNAWQSKPVLDPAGNFYVVTSTGGGVRLARFSPNKILLWERFYNSPFGLSAPAVAADASGVYMAGRESNAAWDANIFLRKYDASGNLLWHKVYHNPGGDEARDVAVDASGNVYVAGSIYNGVNNDIWLGKYDAGGNLLWTRTYNSPSGWDDGYGVAVDKSDNVIVVGSEDRNDLLQGNNIWVRKYDAAGTVLWTRTYNSPSNGWDNGYSVAVDNLNSVIVAGSEDRYDLNQANNIWVGKYDANGNLLWTRSHNGPANGYDAAYGAASDNFGNIYVSGQVSDSLWVGKYGPGGGLVNHIVFSTTSVGYGIKVSSAGTVNVIGRFGMSVGVYYYDQGPVSSSLSAYHGPYAGSVGLSWNYTTDLPAGSSYYAQASSSPTGPWNPLAAGNIIVSTQVLSGVFQNQTIGGLQTSRDAIGNITSPEYYFKVWTSTNGINFQPMGTTSTATAKTPFISDAAAALPDGSLNIALSGWSNSAPIARDATGNSYLAFGNMPNMGDGYAVRKYDPSGGLLWTRFYNRPGGANYDINGLALDASGNFHVAGRENPGPGVFDAFAAKINSDGSLAWSRTYNGLADGIDAYYAVAVDTAGAVYAAGQESYGAGNPLRALLMKYSSAGADIWTSTFPWVAVGSNTAEGIALYGGAVYVTGKKGVSTTDSDIFLHKYNQVNGSPLWTAATSHSLTGDDSGYSVAVDTTTNYIYVAGRLKASTFSDAWLGKYQDNGTTGALVLASTHNNVSGGGDMNFGVTYAGGYIYTAGYETRGDIINQGDNIRVVKADPVTLNTVWSKTFDAGQSLNERAHSVIVDNAGRIYAGVTINGSPGLYRFSPPYFGLLARPGSTPASAEVYWATAAELPAGSTYYVQYSTFSGVVWSTASAQVIRVTTQTVMSGSFRTLAVPSLDAGRNAAGGIISPLYYFQACYKPYPSQTPVVITSTPSSYPNTPVVSDSAAIYPDSRIFTINQTSGWRNKITRDANGYLYAVANQSGVPGGGGVIVLRKYNPDLSVQWTKFFGGAANENLEGRAVALDASGNIYVTGGKGSWDSPTKQDILVIKYDSAGNRLWYRTYDYSGENDNGYGIATGTPGIVYVIGSAGKPAASPDIFIGRINSFDGSVISSVTVNGTGSGYTEGAGIVFDSTATMVYAVGSVETAGQGANIWLGKYSANLTLVSSATINGASNGWDNGYGVAADGQGNVYITGTINDSVTQGNDILVAKYDSSLNKVWQRTYNDPGNNHDVGYGVTTDALGGVYVTGSESRWDINQGENLFIRKYSETGDTIWTRTFNASGSSHEVGFDVRVDSMGIVYVGGSFNNGYGIYRYRQPIFSNTNPMLTVFISSVSALNVSTPMAGTGLIILPFDATGGVNPALISTGTTDSNGRYAARLPAGFQYFIGISTPGYKPTIKDQMMDPYGSFMVDFLADTTRQYKLYPRAATENSTNTLHINISSGMVGGDYAMAEVFYAKTGEKTAYGIGRSTALNTAFPIHNVPPAAAGVYGVNINIPGRNKAITVYLDRVFPGTNTYTVDMTSAVSMIGFDLNTSTTPPSFRAVVRNTQGAPLDGVRVEISQLTCGTGGCSGPRYENMTDVNGQVSFYSLPISTGDIWIRKAGHRNAWDYYGAALNATVYREYVLQPATYTLTGILKYNGMPLPNARVMAHSDWNWYSSGNDSYRGNNAMQTDAKVNTGADGSFAITGLTDGNVRLYAEFMGIWRDLNRGNNLADPGDDIRIVISSQGAVAPLNPSTNQCKAGRTWALNNLGECLSAGSAIFNIMSSTAANTAGTLTGSLTFVTTYTVTAAYPLEISASSPVIVMVMEQCYGGCMDQKLGFASVSGVFTTNVATYSVTLSTGAAYWSRIYSTEWGQASSFNDQVNLSSITNTASMDFTLTRAGALKGVLRLPDGTSFRPRYSDDKNDPTGYWADIGVAGQNVQVYQGTGLDEYGGFEFPNLAAGRYTVRVNPRGAGFRWPPAELGDIVVAAGETTEIKLRLEDGLVVQPQISGLPALSTGAWKYEVIGVPSGFQMNQRNMTELFFKEPKYIFDYDAAAGVWDRKYLPPGQYDFYLLVTAGYNPGDGDPNDPVSYYQFANFIGRAKNTAVQKSDSNPGLGSPGQPIPVNILGSIGQGEIRGTVAGSKIFTGPDYERIFANFDSEIMPLIPAVMLYDTAGDLRGFGHAMPDEKAFPGFMAGITGKNKKLIEDAIAANPVRYLIWGLPPGRYTAVFVNPNYPPLTREIELPANKTYNFNFDGQNIIAGAITGVVKSSATGEALKDVTVYLKHRIVEKFAVTDSSGNFSFANLPSGIYRLEAARDGFVKAGRKTSLAGSDSARFGIDLLPSVSRITGRVFLGKFPSPSTRAGIKLMGYDETMNVAAPKAYLPRLEAQTDESGDYEINGVIPGHTYRISAFYEGKTPETLEIKALEGETVINDIVLRDIPPQIMVKVRKSPDSLRKVDVVIQSPKRLVAAPVCKYNPGEVFDPAGAVSMALVPGPNNSYLGQFTVSGNNQYYTVNVAAGDGDNRMEKNVLYDKTSEARTEQYIQDEAIAGGEISMDAEREEYSGLELDAGALTTSSGTADFSNLIGGFFSALPNVRTVKTAKGSLTIEASVRSLMASEVYNMDLSNAQPNKPFTLTLKYDKEKVVDTGVLRIYQYNDASGLWKEVPGNYTADPMTGVVSVDVASLGSAYEGTNSADTPLGRKRMGMSAVVNGRYVPSATPAPQSGRFAVMTGPPTTGKDAYSGAFEIFNLPNPFDLKSKNVTLSADALAAAGAYQTSGTVLKFNLPAGKGGNVKFVIYNLAGEKVRTLDMGNLAGGKLYYSEWDGRNDKNKECASGVYFLLPFVNGEKLTGKAHKMAIIK
ncbi:MAG: cellulose-binding [Elusimicrobia bacterium]|nr:MAG: cellulose-binding [Elusimicrobiota bacterium]KAF0156423.1 MAG: cellulose-binding [Elusimicrobiota bacterium]